MPSVPGRSEPRSRGRGQARELTALCRLTVPFAAPDRTVWFRLARARQTTLGQANSVVGRTKDVPRSGFLVSNGPATLEHWKSWTARVRSTGDIQFKVLSAFGPYFQRQGSRGRQHHQRLLAFAWLKRAQNLVFSRRQAGKAVLAVPIGPCRTNFSDAVPALPLHGLLGASGSFVPLSQVACRREGTSKR